MKRIIPLLVVALVATAVWWWSHRQSGPRTHLTYSGVVEATTIDTSFEIAGTVNEVLVREGDSVKKGQPLARLDRRSWQANLAQAEAREGAARARYEQMRNGYRPSEIAQSEARLQAAQADLAQMEAGPTGPELAAARAQMEAARERADMTQEGYRKQDVSAAGSQLASARTSLELARKDYERYQVLHREGAISDQQLEQRKNVWSQAQSALQVAQQNDSRLRQGPRAQERRGAWDEYRSAEARYRDLADGYRPEQVDKARALVQERTQALQLMRDGVRREEVDAARRQWQEAQASVKLAQVQLSKAELKAPVDGQVTVRNLEPGEAVAPGVAVLTLADLKRPWVNLYIPEFEISRVKLGQSGRISGDGMPKPIQGKLERIYEKAEFTPKFIQTPRERVNLVYRAKLAVPNEELLLHPGQPVDVELTP